MKTADRIMAGILILCSAFMLYKTTTLKVLAYQILSNRLFPYLIFSLIILLSLMLFAATFMKTGEAPVKAQWRQMVGRRRMTLLALFAVYLFCIPVAGFIPATGGFVAVSATWLSPRRRRDALVSVLVALGTMGFIYGVFVYWLQAFLP